MRALKLAAPFASLLWAAGAIAEEVPVRYREGRIHGFLVLRGMDDQILASGTLLQFANGNRVTNELTFRFKDGSFYQEASVFSQARTFRLLTHRLVRKGPAFKNAMDLSLNSTTGRVTIHHTDDHGKEQVIAEQLKLPTDLANGMVTTLLGDLNPKATKTTVSMLVATPKPRIVKLDISPVGEDAFTVAGSGGKAAQYVVKVDIGGISGVVAPIIGKQPPDTHIWMVEGKAPGFLKSEGPLFPDGPLWRIELASPVWPKRDSGQKH